MSDDYRKMEERKARGYLWTDTQEYFQLQSKAKGQCYDFNHLRPEEREKRAAMLPEIFGSVGKDAWVEPPLMVAVGKTVTLGDNVYINSNLTLVDDYKITIGNGVLIAPNVVITTTGHPVHHSLRTHGEMYSFEVTIKDNVWIGSNVVICPGVTIGENSVIGAGSIVLREITDRDLEYYYKDLRVADQLDL